MAAVRRDHGSLIRHMRVFLVALAACGSAATNAVRPEPAPTPSTKPRVWEPAPIEVVDALTGPVDHASWVVPGPAQLVLGGASLQANEGAPRLEVSVVEQQGSDVRVGVRLGHARFAIWMARSRLLSIVSRDQRISILGAPIAVGTAPIQVVLRAGAQVQRLARKDGTTRVRYVGALEIEGWLPDDALSDRGAAGRHQHGRIPSGRRPLMLMSGSVIRAEPKWTAAPLAVTNQGYVLDEVKQVDDAWSEVSYEDSDVVVHGYVSKRDPPSRTHRAKVPEPSAPLATNATAAGGTCLYAAGEEVGFLVGDQPVIVEKTARVGWFALTIDTPWGPIAFDAKGPTETELMTCGG
jgi:hypothetical protein